MRKLILWTSLLLATIGGAATRSTAYGHKVAHLVSSGDHVFLPAAAFVLFMGGLAWSIADKSPDLLSMFTMLTAPSMALAYQGGGPKDAALVGHPFPWEYVGWVINAPWNAINALVGGNLDALLDDNVAGNSDIAGFCWFLAISVGVFALVRYVRRKMGKGAPKAGAAPVAPSSLQAAIAGAKAAAK